MIAVRISATMSLYISRQFLVSFFSILAVFLCLIMLFDVVELLRRVAARPEVTFGEVLQLSLLKLPHLGQETFPFAVLFGGMSVFWRLTRSHELTVTRAAGVSAWQFLLPVLAIAFLLGLAKIMILSPFASGLLSRYELVEATLVKGRANSLALSGSGLWLRQAGGDGQSVIHAARVLQQDEDVELHGVIVFNYGDGDGDRFASRVDAETADLEQGHWRMRNAWIFLPEEPARFEAELRVPTDLTLSRIQDSFASPETVSFWSLPAFITTLEAAGFSAVRHRLHFHAMLAAPLLMCAMVLIAATFTLRQARRGGVMWVVGGGVLCGFVLHFFSDVVFAMGLSDAIPATLAAWTPSGVATLLGLAMLLHLEDG